MTIGIISFSERGYLLEEKLLHYFEEKQDNVVAVVNSRMVETDQNTIQRADSTDQWVENIFTKADAIVFIGACGIAVRSIAPYVKDKRSDPAVIVIDELGTYCIPVLSGHWGGANQLSGDLSSFLGAENIITTATDLNHVFAVDLFAKRNQLNIADSKLAKMVSASILAGNEIGFFSECEIDGVVPKGVRILKEISQTEIERPTLLIYLGIKQEKRMYPDTLYLRPQILTVGIGCKKNTSKEQIKEAIKEVMDKHRLSMDCIKGITSIDLKKEELGIILFCKENKLPFFTYSREDLEKISGEFTGSDFVEMITGVDNVCERSAMKDAKNGRLIQHKFAKNGVTVAIAMDEWRITFE